MRIQTRLFKALWILPIMLCSFLIGCYSTHFYNRSVVHYTNQNVETSGTLTSNPTEKNPASIAAEKTTTAETAVNTSEGKAVVTPNNKENTK